MARYKHSDIEDGQGVFLTVNLKEQLLPGTFEYMLNDLIGGKIDVSMFDENYNNDKTGAKAIPPAVLIKLIIYGYSKGAISSRRLDRLAKENIVAKALTGDISPHWTVIADFISGNGKKFQEVFIKVLTYCGELELIGGETFAADGLRVPSNASLEMSGTEEELKKKVEIYQKMAEKHVQRHLKRDAGEGEEGEEEKRHYQERQKRLSQKIEKINAFLEEMEKREGKGGSEIKSNVTDNQSAMIQDSGGYLQGYIGIAVSDQKNQIIVNAVAVGSANECEHMPEVVEKTLGNMKEAGIQMAEGKTATFMGDANYFSEENLRACQEKGVEAIIPDSQYRRRVGADGQRRYEAFDFTYQEEGDYYECPFGKKLPYKGKSVLRGHEGKRYQASVKDCRECPYNSRCIRSKKAKSKRDRGRQLLIMKSNEPGSLCRAMREKMSSEEYQERYAYRIQIIEPVFANISYCKGMDRFTLRGDEKVNGQWKLYCMVHNLGKCVKGYNKEKEIA